MDNSAVGGRTDFAWFGVPLALWVLYFGGYVILEWTRRSTYLSEITVRNVWILLNLYMDILHISNSDKVDIDLSVTLTTFQTMSRSTYHVSMISLLHECFNHFKHLEECSVTIISDEFSD